ncbi:MAG: S-adenosylmethionine:tRNA ribosyltransferase-isomerase [Cyclobacteriaceae bacterium]|nr:S-adenosylmethionine:tRNA ribosyltransferase-isomerase [Cyclobacteriaceae bacterium]
MNQSIPIKEYTYTLPEERIAHFPLEKRDESKLLVYQNKTITHTKFNSLTDYLPENATLFFNNTRVIQARLLFRKDTGAGIEIFLLQPEYPSPLLAEVMQTTETCRWRCTIGNLKRWKEGELIIQAGDIKLSARLVNRDAGIVELNWTPKQKSFSEVVTQVGLTPLPPYIKRNVDKEDEVRYQTIYSTANGAVAAPTAGLHFTDNVLKALQHKGIKTDFLTLHVSAGTFQPVKTENATDHVMHQEQIVITKKNIDFLLENDRFITAAGTTSMRTLESLYWFGVKLLHNPQADFIIEQRDPYKPYKNLPDKTEALSAVRQLMESTKATTLTGHTSIFILPGYTFRVCNGLITNFHLPGSTLMLLVAAFVGHDWKKIYDEALVNQYRFLSYGDSSLLMP